MSFNLKQMTEYTTMFIVGRTTVRLAIFVFILSGVHRGGFS